MEIHIIEKQVLYAAVLNPKNQKSLPTTIRGNMDLDITAVSVSQFSDPYKPFSKPTMTISISIRHLLIQGPSGWVVGRNTTRLCTI